MVWRELQDHWEVVYGAALALVIVVVLTPAVAGMARRLGAVDMPDERRVHRFPIPLLVGAAVATVVGAIDDFRGLRWWEKLGGQVVAGAIPPIFGVWIDHFTFPF